ncbi:MAG: bifunctional 2-keto-4-hydroxyglutarate aldolase/2-keto-3-deoxy-6-phosphogluconate aldolase [Oscillospiraceae bacterium]|nr:bifunctional 2-keto-4-hydroxyglutarate aldolase/2-keto-3-deoxy-6-phosphogluconate aldolase [Oscillospiraceae bacterium]
MDKEKVIERIREVGLVAVVRAENEEKAIRITEACIEGGVAAIELTFTVPFAHNVIESLAKRYSGGEIIVGAGTVLDSETARIAILSGSEFVVSPMFSKEVVKLCNRYRTAVMPGVVTPKEAVEALEAGADILKVFPGDLFGPNIIKALKGPLPQGLFMPTGGVDKNNVGEWIKAGAVAVGAGGSLTAGAKTGEYDKIVSTAKEFLANINKAREELKK